MTWRLGVVASAPGSDASGLGEIDDLKRQMADMQKRLDRLADTDK